MNWKHTVCAAFACISAGTACSDAVPMGELQVASLNVLLPQINQLATKAQLPMLPMLVPQLVDGEMAKKFGELEKDRDWGVKLFLKDDGEIVAVPAWPLAAGGKEKWLKNNAGLKPEAGVWRLVRRFGEGEEHLKALYGADEMVEYAAFSQDGKWVFLAQEAEFAKKAAALGAPFAKPLAKGMFSCTISGEKTFDSFDTICKKSEEQVRKMKEAAGIAESEETAADGATAGIVPPDFPGPEAKDFALALLKEFKEVRLLAGVSSSGIDLRLRATPRDDSAIASDCGVLPKARRWLDGLPQDSIVAFAAAPFRPAGALGGKWNDFVRGSLKRLNDHIASLPGKAEKPEEKSEAEAFAATFGYFKDGVEAFAASGAKSQAASFYMAENSGGAKSYLAKFDLAGGGRAGFDRQPPAGVLKTDTGKVFSVGGKDKGWKNDAPGRLADAFAEAVPEAAGAERPVLAGRYVFSVGVSAENTKPFPVWLFGWKDKSSSCRALLRMTAKDFGELMAFLAAATMQIQP